MESLKAEGEVMEDLPHPAAGGLGGGAREIKALHLGGGEPSHVQLYLCQRVCQRPAVSALGGS